jgi:protein-tyrosine phosphatase
VAGIFWIDGNPAPGLASVACPHGDAELKGELQRLKRSRIDTLVSLLEQREAEWLGLGREREYAEKAGLEFLSYPIPDTTVPSNVSTFRAFVANLADRLRQGQHVGVHCRGSIGRATVTAACTLIHLGWEPQAALTAIEQARGLGVPDTDQQREWILAYEVKP